MQYRLSEFFWGGSLLLPTSVLGQTRTWAESSTAGKDQQGPARIGKNMVLPTYIFRFGGFVKLSPGWMVLPGQNSWWHPLVLLYRQLTCNIDIQHWNIGLKYTGHQTCNRVKNIISKNFQKQSTQKVGPCFFLISDFHCSLFKNPFQYSHQNCLQLLWLQLQQELIHFLL